MEAMVRIEINLGGLRKCIFCFRFPDRYPDSPILLELKSRTLADDLLSKLTNLAEVETKSIKGPQILAVTKFLKRFFEENPLSVCYNEITQIKKLLSTNDSLRLKQKASLILLTVKEEKYYFRANLHIPDDYFCKPPRLVEHETNLPGVLEKYIIGQAIVIGQKCTESPATRLVKFRKGKAHPVAGRVVVPPAPVTGTFEPEISLEKMVRFIVEATREFVRGRCQLCKEICLPSNPEMVQKDETASDHVERIYCGHLFHLSCLLKYMKTPPFKGGKKCQTCGDLISHEKWRLSEKLAEDRWAHEQAKDRELREVADFFD